MDLIVPVLVRRYQRLLKLKKMVESMKSETAVERKTSHFRHQNLILRSIFQSPGPTSSATAFARAEISI
jgi:hypothetical protein